MRFCACVKAHVCVRAFVCVCVRMLFVCVELLTCVCNGRAWCVCVCVCVCDVRDFCMNVARERNA